MRPVLASFIVFAAAVLTAAPAAEAKGPLTKLKVCGQNGCATVPDDPSFHQPNALGRLFRTAVGTAPPPGPYFEVRAGLLDGGVYTAYYLTGGSIVSGGGGWARLDAWLAARID